MNRRTAMAMAMALTGCAAAWAWTAAQAQAALVAGEVVKVDRPAGRVTLKQGEIKALDMPPMTLSWHVAQPRVLEDLAVGDRVRFVPARIDGQYTITALVKAPQ
jgi:Cu/Ag efflux protein CusF